MGQAHTVLDTEYSRECPVPHLVFVISTVTENNTGSTPPRTVMGFLTVSWDHLGTDGGFWRHWGKGTVSLEARDPLLDGDK